MVFCNSSFVAGAQCKFTSKNGTISILADELQGAIQIKVLDNGAGIAHENIPKVFDRFWQAKDLLYRGTGLGLPISKGLVEANGGKIWVESKPGVGSTFFFTLPIYNKEEFKQWYKKPA